MITLHWGIVAVAIVANAIVAIALIMQLSNKLDRQTQRENELQRQAYRNIADGVKIGHDIFVNRYVKQLQRARNRGTRNGNDETNGDDDDHRSDDRS